MAAQITAPQYVDEKVLEAITGIRRRTWQKFRLFGTGPRFYRLQGSVRYRLDEVIRWIDSNGVGEVPPAPPEPH